MYVEESNPGETNIDEAGKILLEAVDYIERHGGAKAYMKTARRCVQWALFITVSGEMISRAEWRSHGNA